MNSLSAASEAQKEAKGPDLYIFNLDGNFNIAPHEQFISGLPSVERAKCQIPKWPIFAAPYEQFISGWPKKRLRARLGRLRTAFRAGPGQSEEEALSQPGADFPKEGILFWEKKTPGGGVQIGSNETLGFKSPLKRRFRVNPISGNEQHLERWTHSCWLENTTRPSSQSIRGQNTFG